MSRSAEVRPTSGAIYILFVVVVLMLDARANEELRAPNDSIVAPANERVQVLRLFNDSARHDAASHIVIGKVVSVKPYTQVTEKSAATFNITRYIAEIEVDEVSKGNPSELSTPLFAQYWVDGSIDEPRTPTSPGHLYANVRAGEYVRLFLTNDVEKWRPSEYAPIIEVASGASFVIWPTGLVVTSRKMDRERFWAYMNEHHSGMTLADLPRAQPLSPFFAICEAADPPPQSAMDWLSISACYDPTTDRYFLITSGGYFGIHETYGPIVID